MKPIPNKYDLALHKRIKIVWESDFLSSGSQDLLEKTVSGMARVEKKMPKTSHKC
jgi:hypothetical protein